MPRLLRIHQSLDRGGEIPGKVTEELPGTGKMAIEIVDLPIKNMKNMVIFHSFLYVYQRVKDSSFRIIISGGYTFKFAFKGFLRICSTHCF